MTPLKTILFIFGTLAILFGLTFLAGEGQGTQSDHIDLGFAEIKYPTSKKFLEMKKPEKKDLNALAKTFARLEGSEEALDSMMLAARDSSYNKMDTTLTGLQVTGGDVGAVQNGIRLIEFPEKDRTLFHALFAKLDAIKSQGVRVRAIHYGDSQIEGDRITAYVRDKMQTLFGGNGPGFMPIKPVYNQITVNVEPSANWLRYAVFGGGVAKLPHGKYGAYTTTSRFTPVVADSTITDSTAVTEAWVKVGRSFKAYGNAQAFNLIRIHYGNCRHHVDIRVFNGEEQIVSDSLQSDGSYHVYTIRLGATPTDLRIEFSGKDSPDFYGMTLDGNYGFNMDNVAMRGSSGTVFGKIDFTELNAMLDYLNTDLIIMQFGGNLMPYLESEDQAQRNAKWFKSQINRMKQARPGAQILVIGPSDMSTKIDGEWQTYPLMEYFIAQQKVAAHEAGAAYWDMYRAMGGENSMITWVEEYQWAGEDYTHFSPAGVKNIARLLFQALFIEYQNYQAVSAANAAAEAAKQEENKVQEDGEGNAEEDKQIKDETH